MKLIALAVGLGIIMTARADAATAAAVPSASPGAVVAAAPTLSPGRAVVQATLDSAKALPASKADPKARRKLLDTIDNSIALDLIAEQSLGPQWAKLKQSERRRYVALLTEAFEKLAFPEAGAFLNGVTVTILAD